MNGPEHEFAGRRRWRVAGAGAVLATLGVGLGAALVAARPPATTTVAADPGAPAGEAVPAAPARHLGLDVPGWRATSAATEREEGTGVVAGKTTFFQAYRDPARDLTGPFVHLVSGPAEALPLDGLGGEETVDLAGGRRATVVPGDGAPALGWAEPDGTSVVLSAHGVSRADLVVAARGARRSADPAAPWELPALPGGLRLVEAAPADTLAERAGEATDVAALPLRRDHVSYEGPGGKAVLEVLEHPLALEDLAGGRLRNAVGPAEAVTVRGRPGVLVDGGNGDYSVVWAEADGVAAVLGGAVDSKQVLVDLLAGVVDLDAATWARLLAESPDPMGGPAGPDGVAVDPGDGA